jgi:hypothetical protein
MSARPDPIPLHHRRWLTVAEAAVYTHTDQDWIRARLKAGELRAAPTARRTTASDRGPRRLILDRMDLDALLERWKVSLAPEVGREQPSGEKPRAGAARTPRSGEDIADLIARRRGRG